MPQLFFRGNPRIIISSTFYIFYQLKQPRSSQHLSLVTRTWQFTSDGKLAGNGEAGIRPLRLGSRDQTSALFFLTGIFLFIGPPLLTLKF